VFCVIFFFYVILLINVVGYDFTKAFFITTPIDT